MKKESFTLFMKQVAVDLQQSGNLGTAHVYRSTLNAILTFQGSDRLSFREITPEWHVGVVGIRCLRIFARCVRFTIALSIFGRHHTCRIFFDPYIQVRGQTAAGHWIWRI